MNSVFVTTHFGIIDRDQNEVHPIIGGDSGIPHPVIVNLVWRMVRTSSHATRVHGSNYFDGKGENGVFVPRRFIPFYMIGWL